VSRVNVSLDHKRVPHLVWLVLTVSVLLGYSLQSVAGGAYYSLLTQTYTTVDSPPVILENGTVGTSTIYSNKTCAKVSVSGYGYDFVDNNDSDEDDSPDKGTHSNFTAQQYGPDSVYDTLTETLVEGGAFGKTTIGGSTTQVDSPHTTACKFTAPEAGNVTSITIWLGGGSLPSAPRVVLYSDSAGSPSSLLKSATFTPAGGWNTVSITAYSMTAGEVLWLGITASGNNFIFAWDTGATNQLAENGAYEANLFGTPTFSAKEMSVYANYSTVATYLLDLEVQWTSADYIRTNEELRIRTGTFSGSENIQVKVWNSTGSSWHWVMNLTAGQWNNVSITSYLTSSTITVQFLGGTEIGDTTQDSWSIDATLLHVGTDDTTFDYVLRVNNTETDSWQIRLKKYSDSNINRLQNCTIYFHNSSDGTSRQIYIQNGAYINQTGPCCDLDGSETIDIAMTAQANSTGTSYVRVYLEILTSGTTTYAQYVIAFEIT